MYPNVYVNQPSDPFSAFWGLITGPGGFLVIIGILVLIFLILREFVCWYWKINRAIEIGEGIERQLSGINKSLKELSQEPQIKPQNSGPITEPPKG